MEGKKGTSKTRMPTDLAMFITELDSWPPLFSERREKEKKKAGKEKRKRNQEK